MNLKSKEFTQTWFAPIVTFLGSKKLNKNIEEWVSTRETTFVIGLWFHSPWILN
jgi:hypothetical protein